MDRISIDKLLARQKLSRWIENMSRSYRDKFQKALMDRNCAKICRERSPKVLIDSNLSRIYREAVELEENEFFKEWKNT